jgi:hypothetical protein
MITTNPVSKMTPLKLSDAFLGHYLNHNCGVFSSMVSKMVSTKRISGWLFEDLSTKKFTFVSRYGRVEETKISWHLLTELGNLEAFRRDFSFEETEMNNFRRFTIDIEVANLSKWFEIREEK